MTFAVPIPFFKSISIIFGGAGLIFEGLTNRGGCWNEKLSRRQPSKIKPGCASEESFLGDALSKRDRDRIRMKALSLWPCAFGSNIAFRGTAIPAPAKLETNVQKSSYEYS